MTTGRINQVMNFIASQTSRNSFVKTGFQKGSEMRNFHSVSFGSEFAFRWTLADTHDRIHMKRIYDPQQLAQPESLWKLSEKYSESVSERFLQCVWEIVAPFVLRPPCRIGMQLVETQHLLNCFVPVNFFYPQFPHHIYRHFWPDYFL